MTSIGGAGEGGLDKKCIVPVCKLLNYNLTCFYQLNCLQSMEAEGALKMFQRSEEKRKLRYIPYVGDGDSKSYSKVQNAAPYGPAVYIDKEECIAHVTKRMGSNLRAVVTKYKGKLFITNLPHFFTGFC